MAKLFNFVKRGVCLYFYRRPAVTGDRLLGMDLQLREGASIGFRVLGLRVLGLLNP